LINISELKSEYTAPPKALAAVLDIKLILESVMVILGQFEIAIAPPDIFIALFYLNVQFGESK
jgi:hypothetical protein